MKTKLLISLFISTTVFAQQRSPSWEKVSKHDADKDGKVTKLEFKGPDRAFTRFDSDKDGSITEAEMKNVAGKDQQGGKGGGNKVDNAPAVGSEAPKLQAQKLGSTDMVDLGNIKKPTVLIFGSYT